MRTPRTARMLLFASLALIATFLVWAHFAVLDEVKRGSGKVVPARQIQVVQSLEGGIISEILVSEGTMVEQGQPLARIEDTNFASQFGEYASGRRRWLRASSGLKLKRKASLSNFRLLSSRTILRAVASEKNVYDARAKKLAQDIDVIQQQEAQKRREIDELRASEGRFSDTLKLLSREVELTRNLFNQRVVPEIEMLRVDRQATDMRGQLLVR